MSSACFLSFHPWFISTQSGTSVTERMVSIISLSLSRPSFTFKILNPAASFTFSITSFFEAIPIVNEVFGVSSAEYPHILCHGWFIIFPVKSCRAMSIDAFAAAFLGAVLSTYPRISSILNGSVNWLKSRFDKNFVAVLCDSPK